jgi:hypothetical protein
MKESAMPNPSSALMNHYDEDVIEFINQGIEIRDERRFNELALKAFEIQYQSKGAYREYCRSLNASPETVNQWEEIPAVSSFALRKLLLRSYSSTEAEKVQIRSRVVELRHKRGPFFPDKDIQMLVASANRLMEKAYVFPDIETIKMLFMVPVPVMAPGMVMASGLEQIKQQSGTDDSGFLISFRGLDLKRLISALRHAEKTGQPLAMLGATWGFDYFLDSCKREGIRFRLPAGSRIVDSGGYVGRYVKCTKEEFFGKCTEVLGIKEDYCINALWLCESSTVYFDNVLSNSLAGIRLERYKEIPPWSRTIVVDPLDFRRLPKGKVGLLRHCDLSNRAMAIVVQTDKMGYETENGFEVAGKWNYDMHNPSIERLPRHPGGKIVSSVMDTFLGWKFSRIGKIYSSLE